MCNWARASWRMGFERESRRFLKKSTVEAHSFNFATRISFFASLVLFSNRLSKRLGMQILDTPVVSFLCENGIHDSIFQKVWAFWLRIDHYSIWTVEYDPLIHPYRGIWTLKACAQVNRIAKPELLHEQFIQTALNRYATRIEHKGKQSVSLCKARLGIKRSSHSIQKPANNAKPKPKWSQYHNAPDPTMLPSI